MDIKRLLVEIYIILTFQIGVGTETAADRANLTRARFGVLPIKKSILSYEECMALIGRPIPKLEEEEEEEEKEIDPRYIGLNGTGSFVPGDYKDSDYITIDLMTSENVVKNLWEVGPKFYILPEEDYPGPVQLQLFSVFNKNRFKIFSTHGLSFVAVSFFLKDYMELNTFVSLTGFSYINAVSLCDCFYMDKITLASSLKEFIENLQSPPVIDPIMLDIKRKDFYTLRWIGTLAKKSYRLFSNEQALYIICSRGRYWEEERENWEEPIEYWEEPSDDGKDKNKNWEEPSDDGKDESELKAYSSVVERTAHNGLVVGSNPAKPS